MRVHCPIQLMQPNLRKRVACGLDARCEEHVFAIAADEMEEDGKCAREYGPKLGDNRPLGRAAGPPPSVC